MCTYSRTNRRRTRKKRRPRTRRQRNQLSVSEGWPNNPPMPRPSAGGVVAASTSASPTRAWPTSTRSPSACANGWSSWLRSVTSGGVGAGGVATCRQRRHPAQGSVGSGGVGTGGVETGGQRRHPARSSQPVLNRSFKTASLPGTWRSCCKPPEKRPAAF